MKRKGGFMRSLLPVILFIIIQVVSVIPAAIFTFIKQNKPLSVDAILGLLTDQQSIGDLQQLTNLIYVVIALVVFGIWYHHAFIRPYQKQIKKYPQGFTFHTLCGLFFLAIGMQYICSLILSIIETVAPARIASYESLMQAAGFGHLSVYLVVFSVILAPFVEELVFRGLVFRTVRLSRSFWAANIWQALLFGLIHMNLVQGIYAFVMGLFIGWVCHRGHGIKYAIVLHIMFNLINAFLSDLIDLSTAFLDGKFVYIGMLFAILGIWIFYTDFKTE